MGSLLLPVAGCCCTEEEDEEPVAGCCCTEEEDEELLKRRGGGAAGEELLHRREQICWRRGAREGGDACGLGAVSLSLSPLLPVGANNISISHQDCFPPKTAFLPGWQAQGVQHGLGHLPGCLSTASDALKLKADALLRYLRQAGPLELAGCPDAYASSRRHLMDTLKTMRTSYNSE